jgi:sulfate adenylyltransferase subunit 1 (EFTu-like GTPase family)
VLKRVVKVVYREVIVEVNIGGDKYLKLTVQYRLKKGSIILVDDTTNETVAAGMIV